MNKLFICALMTIALKSYCQDSLQIRIDKIDKVVNKINSNKALFEIRDSSYSIDSSFHTTDDFTKTIYYSDQECGKLLKVQVSILLLKDSTQLNETQYFDNNEIIKSEFLILFKKLTVRKDFYFQKGKVLGKFSAKDNDTALTTIDNSKQLLQNYLAICHKPHSYSKNQLQKKKH